MSITCLKPLSHSPGSVDGIYCLRKLIYVLVWIGLIACTLPMLGGTPGWRQLSPMSDVRFGHDVVQLHTGDLVVIGGRNSAGVVQGTSFLIDAATGSYCPLVNQDPVPRTNSAVVAVKDAAGQSIVYVIGGYTGGAGTYVSSAAITRIRYDSVSKLWSYENVGTLPVAVGDCRAVSDGAGNIIVSGGRIQSAGPLGVGVVTKATASINIQTGVVRRLGDHITARAAHAAYCFLDQNLQRTVAVAGGEDAQGTSTELLAGTVWDPRANAPLIHRTNLVGISDNAGIARAFGGESGGTPVATCEWYDYKSGWRNAPRMIEARADFDVTQIAGTRDTAAAYITVAGRGTGTALRTCEIFTLPSGSDPAGMWVQFSPLNTAASGRQVAVAGNNLPVVVGGNATSSVECFQPLSIPNVSFPSTEVGARSDSVPIVVTNTWMLPIEIKKITVLDGADFIVAVDTTTVKLAAGESRTLLGWFRPSMSGMRTSRLVVNLGMIADTVLLSGTGLASTVEVLTAAVDFGDVRVDSTRKICLPVLKNNGSDTAWIDSIVIEPPGVYVVESPVGRVAVAPGTSLEVCFTFTPATRGVAAGSASLHIGPRSYPVSVIGNGYRTLAVLRQPGCDTVSAQRSEEVRLSAMIENVADRDIQVSAISLATSLPGIARLADSSAIPFTLRPNELRFVDVILTVQKEGEERIQLSAISNSDSAVGGVLCAVVLSRSVVPSISAIAVGDLCIGDTVSTTVILTNTSAVESITITDVTVENTQQAQVDSGTGFVLSPRSSKVLRVTVTASQPGAIAGSLVVNSTRGSTAIPIQGRAMDALAVVLPSASMQPGDIKVLPVEIKAISDTVTEFSIAHAYDMLAITGVSTMQTDAVVSARSSVQRESGGTRIRIVWDSPLPIPVARVGIQVEALRGSDVVSKLYCERSAIGEACVSSDTSEIAVNPNCGLERSLVRMSSGANVRVSPTPATDNMIITVSAVNRTPQLLRIVDADGIIHHSVVNPSVSVPMSIGVSDLPAGIYSAQLFSEKGLEDSYVFVVLH